MNNIDTSNLLNLKRQNQLVVVMLFTILLGVGGLLILVEKNNPTNIAGSILGGRAPSPSRLSTFHIEEYNSTRNPRVDQKWSTLDQNWSNPKIYFLFDVMQTVFFVSTCKFFFLYVEKLHTGCTKKTPV